MLLTDDLINELHSFRIEMMKRLVTALRKVRPLADGREIGVGYASFPGDGNNLTQVYGISHRGASYDLAEVEAFFEGKANNWELIVTPFESAELMSRGTKLGYQPDHFESVLAMKAAASSFELPQNVNVVEMGGDLTLWARVSDAAWCETNELADELSWIGKIAVASPSRRFMALVEGQPAATASMVEIDGKIMFTGAATLPKYRGMGLQTALTNRRLAEAGSGAFVHVVALPGSQSHRNLQRIGFSPLYSKLVMFRQGIPT